MLRQFVGQEMAIGRAIQAEDELDARVVGPAIQMLRLAEVGVAAQEHLAKAALQTNPYGAIDLGRGPFVRGAIAGTVDDAEDFAGVGQRDDQRMIAPDAVVGDVHALLAFAGRLDHGAVHVDAGRLEERVGLASPDALAHVVEDVEQRVDILGPEASAEIAGRGRIGNARGSEGVEEDFVLATQFEILQTGAVAQRVVGEVEDMIGFVVGKMELEQMEPFVDGLDESAASGQEVNGPDAAVGDAAIAEGELVVDVGGGEARPLVRIDLKTLDGFGPILVEATLKTALAASPLIS